MSGARNQLQPAISNLNQADAEITLPEHQDACGLQDYVEYLAAVDGVYHANSVNLNKLKINCLPEEFSALAKSFTFFQTTCNVLEIECKAFEDFDELMKLILVVDNKNIPTLKLTGEINQGQIQELIKYVKEKKIAVDIVLPEAWVNTNDQKQLDQLTEEYAAEKRKNKFIAPQPLQLVPEKPDIVVDPNRIPRTRSRVKVQTPAVQVEAEQEQQADQQAQAVADFSTEVQSEMQIDSQIADACEEKALGYQEFATIFQSAVLGKYESKEWRTFALGAKDSDDYMSWVGMRDENDGDAPKLTESAIKEILSHSRQFQYGIDISKLPAGFVMVKSGEGFYIHFDKNIKKDKKASPLAVNIRDIPDPIPLTFQQAEACLAGLRENHALKKIWKNINENEGGGYNREICRLFRTYLPRLLIMEMDMEEQNFLLEVLFPVDNERVKENFSKVIHLIMKDDLPDYSNSEKDVGCYRNLRDLLYKITDENIKFRTILSSPAEKIIKFKLAQKTPPKSMTRRNGEVYLSGNRNVIDDISHPVWKIISEEQAKGEVFELKRKVPSLNLGGILNLYLQFGSVGIEKLVKLYDSDPARFNNLDQLIFSKNASYAVLMEKECIEALDKISTYSGTIKSWWGRMFEAHCRHNENVNLPDMVNAFEEFKRQISGLYKPELSFPKLEDGAFAHVENLPVALSHIVAILKNSSEDDRPYVMNGIQNLEDFSSSGLTRHMLRGKRWPFLTHEMGSTNQPPCSLTDIAADRIKKAELSEQKGELEAKDDRSDVPLKQRIVGTTFDSDKLLRVGIGLTYLSIANADRQQSLQFYKYAFKTIEENFIEREKFPYDVVAKLVCLVAYTTCNNNAIGGSFEYQEIKFNKFIDAMKALEEKCGQITIVQGDAFNNMLGNMLYKLESFPSVELCADLIQSIASASVFELVRMDNHLEKLSKHIAKYGPSVYWGMQVYKIEDHNSRISLPEHLGIIDKIDATYENEPVTARILIQAIALHGLNLKNIDGIGHIENVERAKQAESILKDLVNPRASIQLSRDQISSLFGFINQSHESVIDVIRNFDIGAGKKLGEYFPAGYFELVVAQGKIDEECLKLIDGGFDPENRDLVKRILARFNSFGDNKYYKDIVLLLVDIARPPMATGEANHFLLNMSRLDGLYAPQCQLETDHVFIKMLQKIKKARSTQPFFSMVVGAENSRYVSENLANKMNLYLRHFSPLRVKDFYQKVGSVGGAQESKNDKMDNNISASLLDSRARSTVLSLHPDNLEEKAFDDTAEKIYKCFEHLNAIAFEKTACTLPVLSLYDQILKSPGGGETVKVLNLLEKCEKLEKMFLNKFLPDKTINTLCFYFGSDKSKYSTDDLFLIFSEVEKIINEEKRAVLFKVIAAEALKGANIAQLLSQVKELVQLCGDDQYYKKLTAIFQSPPCPSLSEFLQWHKDSLPSLVDDKNDVGAVVKTYAEKMEEKRKIFNLCPAVRDIKNKFDVNMSQVKNASSWFLTNIDTDAFRNAIESKKNLSTDDLRAQFKSFKRKEGNVDYQELVAVAAELLFRSMAQELNATQYLAILAALQSEDPITCQIGTGEGKTRIMMVMNACSFALGKTVDFVTSDVQLARRDFEAYQPYFDVIEAKTAMIFSNSPFSTYQKDGINFSDPASISLFRNRARSEKREEQVLNKDQKLRALHLDEADKTYFDSSETRYNYSGTASPDMKNMEWIYPLFIEFFLDKDNRKAREDLYFDDVDGCREAFTEFVRSKPLTPDMMAAFNRLSAARIEQWQESAVTALSLKYNEHFTLKDAVIVQTPSGKKLSAQALLLHQNRVMHGSNYSMGVQQCLHARLNYVKGDSSCEQDKALIGALSACQSEFYVASEKQIIYSSTSTDLIDDYSAGTVKGVTGTAGLDVEREEAAALYASSPSGKEMTFVDVPRHAGMKRKDRAYRLAGNEAQQFEYLIEEIQKARQKKQPVLLIVENDKESEKLFNKIKSKFPDSSRIHSNLSADEESALIDKAGMAGMVTVSTPMTGRGTDIPISAEGKAAGLHVMLTYLPRKRDYEQIIGRSGRFGGEGESTVILDKRALKSQLGKTTLTDGFYANPEVYIEREQALMDREKQCERLIVTQKNRFERALRDISDAILQNPDNAAHSAELACQFSRFFENINISWSVTLKEVRDHLADDPLNDENIDIIENKLQAWADGCKSEWNKLPEQNRHAAFPQFKLDDKIKMLLKKNIMGQYDIDSEMKPYSDYERGHEGRAVRYNEASVPWKATLQGYANLFLPKDRQYENARRPFASFRAWREGRGRLFANLRVSKSRGAEIGLSAGLILGGVIAVSLIATGILAPAGVLMLGVVGAGAVLGGTMGGAGGAIFDYIRNKKIDAKLKNHPKKRKRNIPPSSDHPAVSKSRMSQPEISKKLDESALKRPANESVFTSANCDSIFDVEDDKLKNVIDDIIKGRFKSNASTSGNEHDVPIVKISPISATLERGAEKAAKVFVNKLVSGNGLKEEINLACVVKSKSLSVYGDADKINNHFKSDHLSEQQMQGLWDLVETSIKHYTERMNEGGGEIKPSANAPLALKMMLYLYCQKQNPLFRYVGNAPVDIPESIRSFVEGKQPIQPVVTPVADSHKPNASSRI